MNIVSKTGVVAGDVTESPQKKNSSLPFPFDMWVGTRDLTLRAHA